MYLWSRFGRVKPVDDMSEKFLYEGSISKDLATVAKGYHTAACCRWSRKVVHAIFRRCEVLGAKVDFDQILKRILHLCMPIPMTAAMLEDGKLLSIFRIDGP